MIAIIRIKGKVDINGDVEETLERLRVRRKYACVVLRENKTLEGMIKKVRDFVAYGSIDKETLVELIKQRGQSTGGKIDAAKIAEEFLTKTNKKLADLGIKPFFRLHPPRGGIKSKLHYPKGVLGENKKINELIRRML